MSEPRHITDWASFVEKLHQQFITVDPTYLARNKLHALKQTGTVREYSIKFRNLQIQIQDMSIPDALDRYIRGLKEFGFKVWRRHFSTLEPALVYAEELDMEVQQKASLNSSSRGREGNTSRPSQSYYRALPPHESYHSRPHYPQRDSRPEPANYGPEPTPMELGTMQRDIPRMSDSDHDRHRQQDLCFFCHKPGHRAGRCPRKEYRDMKTGKTAGGSHPCGKTTP
jgi:hypothetical protein